MSGIHSENIVNYVLTYLELDVSVEDAVDDSELLAGSFSTTFFGLPRCADGLGLVGVICFFVGPSSLSDELIGEKMLLRFIFSEFLIP